MKKTKSMLMIGLLTFSTEALSQEMNTEFCILHKFALSAAVTKWKGHLEEIKVLNLPSEMDKFNSINQEAKDALEEANAHANIFTAMCKP